jgi:glycosyltransferase involved in cell wall biosynthesis
MKTKTTQRNYEIIVFSDDWNGLPFSCKHLLRHFLPDVRLIWVETIGLRSPKLNLYDINRSITKITGWLSKSQSSQDSLPENLNILDPFQIPYNQLGIVRNFNKQMVIRTLKPFNPRYSNRERVLITTWPFTGNIVGSLGERLSIYYRVDDFSEFPGVRKDFIRQLENELIEKVDMVVASAENLAQVGAEGKTTKYLPHGADFQHFTSVLKESNSPALLKNIPGTRIGFFGLLNSWLDFDLLAQVAKDHPRWSFVFLGPLQISPTALPNAPNFHFLGPVPYDELPAHACHFDVALIPFKINALTISVNPLKLMEYFSLGLPVVSTPLPEVVKYKDSVFIASDPRTFGDAIEKALIEDDEKARVSRQEIAKSHSWLEKSLELKKWIEEALEKKAVDPS